MRRALISTLAPVAGGVPQMAGFVADTLADGGIQPTVAYYYPYSRAPDLSVPLYRMLTRRVKSRQRLDERFTAHEVGAWLPELEFMHYMPTKHWRSLMAGSDFHLSVSGNCLAATPYAIAKTMFWSWVATPWAEDRLTRTRSFSLPRKLLDRLVNERRAQKLEKKILSSKGTVVALSHYTQKKLNSLVESSVTGTMPMGIDTGTFKNTKAEGGRPLTVGFVGRLDDPRKNIELLLSSIRICLRQFPALRLLLIGGGEHKFLDRLIHDYGLEENTEVIDHVANNKLPAVLNEMDIFVIPSSQEGLCIAALEAMSCGVPVISTRCGGPEEFVLDGETGHLVEPNPVALSERVIQVLADRSHWAHLAENARKLVEAQYSIDHVKEIFWSSFNKTFGLQR